MAAISVGSGGQDSSVSMGSPTALPSERSGSLTYSVRSATPASKSKLLSSSQRAAAASEYHGESGLNHWVPGSEMPVPPRASIYA